MTTRRVNATQKADIGTVQEFTTIPQKTKGIQYVGTNGRAVADFVQENGQSAKAGGGWVKVVTDTWGATMKKGDVILVHEGVLYHFTLVEFLEHHKLSATNNLLAD